MTVPGDWEHTPERTPAIEAAEAAGIPLTVTRHAAVASIEEAAAERGLRLHDVVKTLVLRRGEDDFVFVLVPGDRKFSWRKLRALLGTNRLSMPDADEARRVTGYERGAITPFGATHAWPVIADATVAGHTVSVGGGAHGVALTVSGDDVIRVLDAQVADISD